MFNKNSLSEEFRPQCFLPPLPPCIFYLKIFKPVLFLKLKVIIDPLTNIMSML